MTPPTPLRLALLQYPVERPRDVAAFAAKLDTWLARIAGQADLAVLPEYAAVELGAALSGNAWAGSTGDGLAVDEAGELRAMTEAAPAILEAMRAELPMIVSDIESLAEFVPAPPAHLVPPGDAAALAALMAAEHRLGRRRQPYDLSPFDPARQAAKIRAVYEACSR